VPVSACQLVRAVFYGYHQAMSATSKDKLADALADYQRDFSARIAPAQKDDPDWAMEIIAEARDLIERSGLGIALAPVLIEHVRHWPWWCKRDDFHTRVAFPAENIAAADVQTPEGHRLVGVLFSYNESRYGVRFINKGTDGSIDEDLTCYGTAEFFAGGEAVLGLDIHNDGEQFLNWRWSNVFALKSGIWMQDLLEIAAHIEESESRGRIDWADEDLLRRARAITL
jgi:hypothetical protein